MARIPKSWVITDTHFNHEMLVALGYRPADYQTKILSSWSYSVYPEDTVYHLGDVIFGRQSELKEILPSLPGTKILIRGNHDRESDGWYRRSGFALVVQGLLVGGVYMTHAPQATLPDGAIINIHGHLHAGTHRSTTTPDHCKLLALEVNGYHPVSLEDFIGFSPMTRKIIMPYEIDA